MTTIVCDPQVFPISILSTFYDLMTDFTFRVPSGVTFAGKVWGNADAPTKVLCLHGWLDCCDSFAPIAPILSRAGCCVVALDLPGHGRSSWLTGSYQHLEYTTQVLAALASLGWRKPWIASQALDQLPAMPTPWNPPRPEGTTTVPAISPAAKAMMALPHTDLSHITTPLRADSSHRLCFVSHSMGAALSVLLSGHMPGEVDAVCLLDGFFVAHGRLADTVPTLCAVLADEARWATRPLKRFDSLDAAATARQRTVARMPAASGGMQSIAFPAARLCVARSMRTISPTEHVFAFDPRIRANPHRLTLDVWVRQRPVHASA
jgi:alpha-beta hydrolase superfamily lysophospholipase